MTFKNPNPDESWVVDLFSGWDSVWVYALLAAGLAFLISALLDRKERFAAAAAFFVATWVFIIAAIGGFFAGHAVEARQGNETFRKVMTENLHQKYALKSINLKDARSAYAFENDPTLEILVGTEDGKLVEFMLGYDTETFEPTLYNMPIRGGAAPAETPVVSANDLLKN